MQPCVLYFENCDVLYCIISCSSLSLVAFVWPLIKMVTTSMWSEKMDGFGHPKFKKTFHSNDCSLLYARSCNGRKRFWSSYFIPHTIREVNKPSEGHNFCMENLKRKKNMGHSQIKIACLCIRYKLQRLSLPQTLRSHQ